ncbi:MAG: hypothetical protein ABI859_18860 [Pseudomonadota bacterium]
MNDSDALPTDKPRVWRRFALCFALTMLAVNLVGFSRTFYLRPFFDVPPIPGYLYVHGAIGTSWFVLVLTQTLLIANRNVAVHRRLGWIGVALATIVMISGMYTSAHMVPRNVALGLTSAADMTLFATVTAADNASFIYFPALVLLAAFFRRRTDVHKRLMLIASLGILGPAAARIASWDPPLSAFAIAPVMYGLLGSLIVYDIVTRRRPHIATVLGILFFMGVSVGTQLSGIGAALVERRMP